MSYYLNMGGWAGVFAVPNSLVDRHIKLAHENELKVILWVFRHGGELFDENRVSVETGVNAERVSEALEYWMAAGLIGTEGNNMVQAVEKIEPSEVPQNTSVFTTSVEETQYSPEISVQPQIKEELSDVHSVTDELSNISQLNTRKGKKDRPMVPDPVYVAERKDQDANVKIILDEAEVIMGKPLSAQMTGILVMAYDDYGMSPEVVISVLMYCQSVGKLTTSYLKSLVIDWGESEVRTMEKAEQKLQELEKHAIAWKKISKIFGIPLRSPLKKESDYAFDWIYTKNLNSDLINEAYSRCISNIGKYQPDYINKILESWYDKGYKTLHDVMSAEAELKSAGKNPPSEFEGGSFDPRKLDELLDN